MYWLELNAENIIEFTIEAIQFIAISWLLYKAELK